MLNFLLSGMRVTTLDRGVKAIYSYKCVVPILFFAVLHIGGCDGKDELFSETEGETQLVLSTPQWVRNNRAIIEENLRVNIEIGDGPTIAARRNSDGGWFVTGLSRIEYPVDTYDFKVTWSEIVSNRSLLLAEFNGLLVVDGNESIEPVGRYSFDGEPRFDEDGDGVSNLAERESILPSDPFVAETIGAANCPRLIGSVDATEFAGLYSVDDSSGGTDEIDDVFYFYISEKGDLALFDYQGDSVDSGENCYIVDMEDGAFQGRSGNTFTNVYYANPDADCQTFSGEWTLERSGNTLTISYSDASADLLQFLVGVSVVDLNRCGE